MWCKWCKSKFPYLYPMLKLLKRLFMKPHSITIPIALIMETPNDMELGALIRSMVQEPIAPPASQVQQGQVSEN